MGYTVFGIPDSSGVRTLIAKPVFVSPDVPNLKSSAKGKERERKVSRRPSARHPVGRQLSVSADARRKRMDIKSSGAQLVKVCNTLRCLIYFTLT